MPLRTPPPRPYCTPVDSAPAMSRAIHQEPQIPHKTNHLTITYSLNMVKRHLRQYFSLSVPVENFTSPRA
eukprot:g29823.t1